MGDRLANFVPTTTFPLGGLFRTFYGNQTRDYYALLMLARRGSALRQRSGGARTTRAMTMSQEVGLGHGRTARRRGAVRGAPN